MAGLSTELVADALSQAVGAWGSMAEYLIETVRHLEQIGIHDPMLWQMQYGRANLARPRRSANGHLGDRLDPQAANASVTALSC